jgi:hypothetical protein
MEFRQPNSGRSDQMISELQTKDALFVEGLLTRIDDLERLLMVLEQDNALLRRLVAALRLERHADRLSRTGRDGLRAPRFEEGLAGSPIPAPK